MHPIQLCCSVAQLKGKEEYLCSAIYSMHSLKALRHGWHSLTCKLHHACLSFVRIHQMAPAVTEVADIQLQLTTHLSTPKVWKAELTWLVDLQQTVYPHKWSPVSYRPRAGQGKLAGRRPKFYHCAMQQTFVAPPQNAWSWKCSQVHIFSLPFKVTE